MNAPSQPSYDHIRAAVIWGFGREGRAARAWLAEAAPQAHVTVVDAKDVSADPDLNGALALTEDAMGLGTVVSRADLLIRSAGVPMDKPLMKALRAAGRQVTTGLDLWMAGVERSRLIGVTGTKGKSTTAALMHHLLQAAGIKAALAGNIGTPLLGRPPPGPGEAVVLEISSYQAADLRRAPARMGLTCLYVEHTDWHGSHGAYVAAKLNVMNRAEHRFATEAAAEAAAPYGLETPRRVPAWQGSLPPSLDAPEARANVGLAVAMVRDWLGDEGLSDQGLSAQGLSDGEVVRALEAWSPLPHRRQCVAVGAGLRFIDDSLATAPEATAAALQAFADARVALIAGGKDRGQDFVPLCAALARHKRAHVIIIGEVAARLEAALHTDAALKAEGVAIHRADSVEAAVMQAADALGSEGGVVLFSPAAASDAPYHHYEARAAAFLAAAEAVVRDRD